MLQAAASVSSHYDQVDRQLLGSSHDIDVRYSRSHFDHISHRSLQALLGDLREPGSGLSLPSWLAIERKWNVHVLNRHSGNVKYVEGSVAFFCDRARQR